MTDTEIKRRKAICEAAHVDEIDDVSDGFHTFRQLYYQRMMLFAAIVKQNKDKAWKSLRHEDGELCFGGGWFIVGIDTPEGSFTYHYEDNYFSLFDCEELECGKHWDGHTEKDVTRLLSLSPTQPEPCEDAVSRADVVDMLEMYPFAEYSEYETAREVVKRLPSVTLKPDHIGDATEMVEYDDCVSRQAVADVAYEVGNLFDGEDDTRTPYGVAFDIQMAVDKLPSVTPKSEPCEDAVSRKAVIDLYKRGAEIIAKANGISVEDMSHNGLDALMNLPSVTPKLSNIDFLMPESELVFYDNDHGFCINTQDVLEHIMGYMQ